MRLDEIKVDTKTVWAEFDGIKGFEVELNYISKTEMTGLIKSCQESKMNRKTRQIENTLDEDKFVKKLVDKVVNNWRGLTVEGLSTLVPVNVNEENKHEEVQFEKESAVFLIKESSEFDTWINDKINDIDTFR